MKLTYEELEAKCLLQQNKLDAINKLMGVIEGASDLAKSGIEKLEQQLAAVVAECACCKQDIEEIAEAMETGTDLDLFLAIDGAMYIETPATDSVLKRIQAQGVEMFAERKNNEMMSLHPDTHAVGSIAAVMSAEVKELREFAAQLRQGAAL